MTLTVTVTQDGTRLTANVTAYVTDGRARARRRSPRGYVVRIETSAEHI